MSNERVLTLVNATILTLDSNDTFYTNGNLVIKGNKIVEIGPTDEIVPKGEIINMSNKIIMPGLVDTHTHSPSTLMRGMADDMQLMDWLKKRIWPSERYLTGTLAYWGAALNCLELLENGITTYADQYYFATYTALAAQKLGLRGFIAPSIFSRSSPESSDTIQTAVDFIEKYKGKESETLIYPCIGPHAPYSCSLETLKLVADIAEKNDILVHIHISETLEENKEIEDNTGLTPTQYVAKSGIFRNRVLSAHSIYLNEKDLDIFQSENVAISYNPVSNLKLVSGIMPLKEILQRGITVSIGTDGAQSNNSLDILHDLKIGTLIQKYKYKDPAFFDAREALRMATINGAKALGIDDKIGTLEKDKLADIISLDLSNSNLRPLHKSSVQNMYSNIVYASSGGDVADVIVNGKVLMENRVLKIANREEIINKAQKASETLIRYAKL